MPHTLFCTAINCMDGRTQLPVIRYLQRRFKVEFVDTITEAGPNRILANGEALEQIEAIRKRTDISIAAHGSNVIAIVGHHDCAGNPVSDEEQWAHLKQAVTRIRQWYPTLTVLALWVDDQWRVRELTWQAEKPVLEAIEE